MKQIFNKLGLLGIISIALLIGGCILISGTFVIVEPFSFTTQSGFYYYNVDITDESDWEDNKDNIDGIDLVGFEMWFDNNEATAITFDVYIDDADGTIYSNGSDVAAHTTQILDGLTLSPGTTHLTYGNSFAYITNVATLKTLVKTGQFHYYGLADGGSSSGFVIDSGKVIVTFSASK